MKKIYIISVPFHRVAKVTLSDLFLKQIASDGHILIISPLVSKDFKSQFKEYSSIQYLNLKFPLSSFAKKIFALSEMLRKYGYWFRYRNEGLRYLYHNRFRIYGENGIDKNHTSSTKVIIFLSGILGYFRYSWKLVDLLFFIKKDVFTELKTIVSKYEQKIFIQSSSWSEQDRLLQKWVKKHTDLNVLVPYTTDQLWTNGYLLAKYDLVFTQGPVEYNFAKKFHRLNDTQLVKFGNLWFRIMDTVRDKTFQEIDNKGAVILYAGVDSDYYPKEGEFNAIKALYIAINSKKMSPVKIIYRPYIRSQEEKIYVIELFKELKEIEFQWIDLVINDTTSIQKASISDSVFRSVKDFSGINLLIMSGATSLALEVAYLSNCAVIANFIDFNNVHLKRKSNFQFDNDDNLFGAPGVTVVQSTDMLINFAALYLKDKKNSQINAKKIYSNWDYYNNHNESFLKQIRKVQNN
jgi:hypothetical protein